MKTVFVEAGKAAWAHILPLQILEKLSPPERWRLAISDPSQAVLVGQVEDEVLGFVVIKNEVEGVVGELDSFYVHPDAWGMGVGRSLLPAALERMRGFGFQSATLWTAELNHRPRRIYEAAGWSLDGGRRERAIEGHGYVELRYRVQL